MTEKTKFWVLVGLTFVLSLCAWQFAISKTIQVFQQNNLLRKDIELAKSADVDLVSLGTQLTLAQTSSQQRKSNESLLTELTTFAQEQSLVITNFEESQRVSLGNYSVNYQPVEVQGSYESILSFVHFIEQEKKLRNINHLRLFIHENRRTKEKNLRATLYLLDSSQ